MKEYMSSKSATGGMYPRKAMSVDTVEGVKLVFFNKKLYLPEKLREKSMKWYFENYGTSVAKTKLVAHYTWPNQTMDISKYEKSL